MAGLVAVLVPAGLITLLVVRRRRQRRLAAKVRLALTVVGDCSPSLQGQAHILLCAWQLPSLQATPVTNCQLMTVTVCICACSWHAEAQTSAMPGSSCKQLSIMRCLDPLAICWLICPLRDMPRARTFAGSCWTNPSSLDGTFNAH